MVNKKEKIEAAIVLLSYLDTIGFYNGKWEFNYGLRVENVNQALMANFTMVMEYMALGGFNFISVKNWKASDDTILMIAVTKALIDGGKEINFIKRYIEIYEDLLNEERVSGNQTLKSINFLKKITQKKLDSYIDKIPFDNLMGGNGAAIRTGPIGIFYANNIDKLISISIIASRLTHNIPLGYLGGLVTALFASYAYNNISPLLWIDNLLELYESNKIQDYIHTTNINISHDKQITDYFTTWYIYKEKRFDDLINFRNKSNFIFAKDRYNALTEFTPKDYFKNGKMERWYLIGGSGIDSVIYAYDALLMSIMPNELFQIENNNLVFNAESLVFFSALHVGDSDSTGAITGFWYGAFNGFNGFDINKMKELEFYKELTKLSNKVNSLL
jgi:ADP-ribosylarginine hydrolase